MSNRRKLRIPTRTGYKPARMTSGGRQRQVQADSLPQAQRIAAARQAPGPYIQGVIAGTQRRTVGMLRGK
jgi:hypothetical protein